MSINQKKGYTLVETMMVMGIIAILFTFGTLSLARLNKEDQMDSLTAEIRLALIQAQKQTVNGNPTGVYFENNRYIVFLGSQYQADDPKNQIITLPQGIIFQDINLPNNLITFLKISGYVENFAPAENFTLLDQETGKIRYFTINKLGVVEVE